MKISSEGKAYLNEVLEGSEIKTIRFYGIPGCCGISLGVDIESAEEDDIIQTIEGIQIAIDPIVEPQLKDITIHAEEEGGQIGLVLQGYSQNSCCKG